MTIKPTPTEQRQAKLDELALLLARHMASSFPEHLKGEEIDSIDLVMLDADTIGCIASKSLDGYLESSKLEILRSLASEFRVVVPVLNDQGKAYFERLEDMVEIVIGLNPDDA